MVELRGGASGGLWGLIPVLVKDHPQKKHFGEGQKKIQFVKSNEM